MPHTKRAIKPAGFFARSAAFAIDLALDAAVAAYVAQLVGETAGIFVGAAVFAGLFILGPVPTPSIGNRFLRITVVGMDGRQIGLRRSTIRFAALAAGTVPFFLGSTLALSDERRQAWHDKVAGTYVIESPFRDRGVREWAGLAVGAETWRPDPFRVTPQKRWPIGVAVAIPLLLAGVTWFVVLPFLRLLIAL